MTKKIAEVLRAIAMVIFGLESTVWVGCLILFGWMRIYDIFWNPSNIETHLNGINGSGILSLFVMLAMIVCVEVTTNVIKKETLKEKES